MGHIWPSSRCRNNIKGKLQKLSMQASWKEGNVGNTISRTAGSWQTSTASRSRTCCGTLSSSTATRRLPCPAWLASTCPSSGMTLPVCPQSASHLPHCCLCDIVSLASMLGGERSSLCESVEQGSCSNASRKRVMSSCALGTSGTCVYFQGLLLKAKEGDCCIAMEVQGSPFSFISSWPMLQAVGLQKGAHGTREHLSVSSGEHPTPS